MDRLALEAIRENARRQRDVGEPHVKTPWYVLVTLCDLALSLVVDPDEAEQVDQGV